MIKIDNVLVATDFSECSGRAVSYARDIAEKFDANLLVLHVTPEAFDYKGYGLSADTILALQQDMQAKIEQEFAVVEKQIGDYDKMSRHLREGRAAIEIVQMAADHAADLIVLGTHGHTGLKHAWLGSTAEKVVRTASRPVLTVRMD